MPDLITVRTTTLEIGCRATGPLDGIPVVLLHGFPYDVRAFDDVVPALAADGFRVYAPYLRGYGPTRFVDEARMRSGQQAAVARDLLEMLDALEVERAILAGYDWGGRAACIAAAVRPERAIGLVTCGGYLIQDIEASARPLRPEDELRLWYQHYFNVDRGPYGLDRHRDELCRLLWEMWSPRWPFDEATYAATAASFANPDFVDVVIHSYRHRFGNADGDPAYDELEALLASAPTIEVPTVILYGGADGVGPAPTDPTPSPELFTHVVGVHVLAEVGHNVPQEAPDAFADAVRALAPR